MKLFYILTFLISTQLVYSANNNEENTYINSNVELGSIIGEIISSESGSPIEFATISLADQNRYGAISDKNGRFRMKAPIGEHQLVISFVGYKEHNEMVSVSRNNPSPIKIKLEQTTTDISKIVVSESQSSRINKSSYNVQSLSLNEIKNTTASVSDALSRMSGVKIRETGGVGSETKISLNGFSGNHVKIFIDGVLMDQSNSAFSLSNMPASFAERIDVYSGVVPIEFGADAIGGVINVVTNKNYRQEKLSIDASYSYGSFNTHQSFLNVGQVFKSGFMYNFNVYQNYSDNDYWVTPEIYAFNEYGTQEYRGEDRVRRFNDAYHNETVIGTIGITNKSWADFLTLKFNYSQYDNEIQTGTTEEVVYGDKWRKGSSMTPTLEYSKRNIIEGLNLSGSVNYVDGFTKNHEGAGTQYDWYGNSRTNASMSGLESEMKNSNWSANATAKYSLQESHQLTLSHNYSLTNRMTRSEENEVFTEWNDPQDNIKNITGLSYRYRPNQELDATVFGKNYMQRNEGWVVSSDNHYWDSQTNSEIGYGAAASYYFVEGLQTKLSYEKSYRLPTSTEIFGDGDLEAGTFELNPESSHNVNLNATYGREFGQHNFVVEGALIYRDTRDYIQRSVASSASRGTSSASYENFGAVETKGYTISLRYDFSKLLSVGGTFNNISSRNAEQRLESSGGSTLTYGLRLPNTPYKYANGDASINLFDLLDKGDSLTIGYDLFYQHEFPLYWETIGYSESKMMVPTQVAHNITVGYGLKGGVYNLSLEARNIMNAELYDNYKLQKAGRAFYAKLRVNINKVK